MYLPRCACCSNFVLTADWEMHSSNLRSKSLGGDKHIQTLQEEFAAPYLELKVARLEAFGEGRGRGVALLGEPRL